jgi:hypothetical protein
MHTFFGAFRFAAEKLDACTGGGNKTGWPSASRLTHDI